MEIEILDYIKDEKGLRKGFVDIKVVYNETKWEIFRNLSLVEKNEARWLSLPSTKRKELWVPTYERSGDMKTILTLASEELKKSNLASLSSEGESVFDSEMPF